LIVPGDLVTGELRSSFLDRVSCSVRTATNAREAIAIATVWQPTLVAFRSSLRGISAAHFCAEIRASGAVTPPRLLMLTDTIGDPLDEASDVDCDAHLISPMDMRELVDTMATLVNVHRRRSPRVPVEVLVQLDGFGLPASSDDALATSLDINEHGILIEASNHLEVGSRGEVLFFLPGSSERLQTQAEVRMTVDELRLHYALEFLRPPELLRESIASFVQEQAPP
jgi:DNA-binding response OmpR family regulator